MEHLEGRTAFITGGASGLGFAMAKAFAGAGMKIAIADVEDGALEKAVVALKEANADVIGIKLDVRDRDAMDAAAAETKAAFGNVHLLVNNAGIGAGGPVQDMTHDDWDWSIGVNLNGVVNGVQSFLKDMIAHGEGGHVVNTASMAGIFGAPGMGPYAATKFAVVGLSESMNADLAETNVGVSVLCPAFVKTNIFDSARNRPAELADTVERERTPEMEAMAEEIMRTAQEPDDVAQRVLEAVREERFWIFTHGELKDMVRMRSEMLLGEFPEPAPGAVPVMPPSAN